MFHIDPITQRIIKKLPLRAADVAQSFDKKQVRSKTLLVKQLKKLQENGILRDPIPKVYIIGGWYGNILIPLLDKHIRFSQIRFYEKDAVAIEISKIFFPNRDDIKYYHKDATQEVFSGNRNLIINTSAEHMETLNIESGVVALQSNNYRSIKEHINCVDSCYQLTQNYNLSKVWCSVTIPFDGYDRYMVIGRK